MVWQIAGLREARYRVDTPREVSAWVADEIDTIAAGWVPLTSERGSDGYLRVLYGRLPPELSAAEHAGVAGGPRHQRVTTDGPILHTPTGVTWGVVMLVALCMFLASFALFARP